MQKYYLSEFGHYQWIYPSNSFVFVNPLEVEEEVIETPWKQKIAELKTKIAVLVNFNGTKRILWKEKC